jgi:hypothetical protein
MVVEIFIIVVQVYHKFIFVGLAPFAPGNTWSATDRLPSKCGVNQGLAE